MQKVHSPGHDYSSSFSRFQEEEFQNCSDGYIIVYTNEYFFWITKLPNTACSETDVKRELVITESRILPLFFPSI